MANEEDKKGGGDPTDASQYLQPSGIDTHLNRPIDISEFIDRGEILARIDAPKPKRGAAPKSAAKPRPAQPPGVDDARVEVSQRVLPSAKSIPLGATIVVVPGVKFDGAPVGLKDKRLLDVETIIKGETLTTRESRSKVVDTFGDNRRWGVQTRIKFAISASRSVKKKISETFDVYCPTTTAEVDPTVRLLACTIYSEGGSRKTFNEDELLAIGWCIQNRVDYVIKEAALWAAKVSQGKQDEADRRWDRGAREWLEGPKSKATRDAMLAAQDPNQKRSIAYRAALSPRQFSGVPKGDWDVPIPPGNKVPEFLKCWDPPRYIDSESACRELVPRAIRIAEAVLNRSRPDPYAGQGARKPKGVFFYKTIEFHRKGIGFEPPVPALPDLFVIGDAAERDQHHAHFPLFPSFPEQE